MANKPSTPIKLYRFPLSGHSHRAELLLSLLGLPTQLVEVDLRKGAHKQPDFLKLNTLRPGAGAGRQRHGHRRLQRDPCLSCPALRWRELAADRSRWCCGGPALAVRRRRPHRLRPRHGTPDHGVWRQAQRRRSHRPCPRPAASDERGTGRPPVPGGQCTPPSRMWPATPTLPTRPRATSRSPTTPTCARGWPASRPCPASCRCRRRPPVSRRKRDGDGIRLREFALARGRDRDCSSVSGWPSAWRCSGARSSVTTCPTSTGRFMASCPSCWWAWWMQTATPGPPCSRVSRASCRRRMRQALRISALPGPGDPAGPALKAGSAVGLLGIEPHSRRRNRLNGTVQAVDGTGLLVGVDQAFGNCPQYIQTRTLTFAHQPGKQPAAPVETRPAPWMTRPARRSPAPIPSLLPATSTSVPALVTARRGAASMSPTGAASRASSASTATC